MDANERLSGDDLASRLEQQALATAIAAARAAGGATLAPRGRCANCGERCLPAAAYCDEDCRADHEARLTTLRRQGRGQ